MKYKRLLYAGIGVFMIPVSIAAGNHFLLSFFLGAALSAVGWFFPRLADKKNAYRVKRSYELDLPDFMDTTAMLLDTGMPLWKTIETAASLRTKETPLYIQFNLTFSELHRGIVKEPIQALERMSMRCGAPAVSGFVSVVIQNYRKGNGELAELFYSRAMIYRNERRNIARRMAEEASTLLLLPSAILLIAMILLMAAPAVIQILKMV